MCLCSARLFWSCNTARWNQSIPLVSFSAPALCAPCWLAGSPVKAQGQGREYRSQECQSERIIIIAYFWLCEKFQRNAGHLRWDKSTQIRLPAKLRLLTLCDHFPKGMQLAPVNLDYWDRMPCNQTRTCYTWKTEGHETYREKSPCDWPDFYWNSRPAVLPEFLWYSTEQGRKTNE